MAKITKEQVTGVPKILFANNAALLNTNTNAETSVIPAGTGSLSLPANFWTVGRVVEFELGGIYLTPAVGGGGVTVRIKIGATTLATDTIPSTALSANSTVNRYFGQGKIVCTSTGASGTVQIDANLRFQTNATVTIDRPLHNDGNAVTIDTTAAGALGITSQWATTSASQGTKTTIAVFKKMQE